MPKELNLDNILEEALLVTLYGVQYTIPLGNTLPYDEAKVLLALTKKNEEDFDEIMEVYFEFFKKYIPEDILRTISISKIKALATAWGTMTEEEGGIPLGE